MNAKDIKALVYEQFEMWRLELLEAPPGIFLDLYGRLWAEVFYTFEIELPHIPDDAPITPEIIRLAREIILL